LGLPKNEQRLMRGDLLKIKQKLTNGGIAHDF